MTRVLFLIKGLGRGGAEQILVRSLACMDREAFEPSVAYLLPWKDALVPDLAELGIGVRCLDGAAGPRWIERLRSLVRSRRIEVMHIHSPAPAVGARLAFRRGQGPRLVYTEHGPWSRQRSATYWGNLMTFPRNDHVFAVSEDVRRTIRYPRWLPAMRMPPVETLHHGIDLRSVAGWVDRLGARTEFGIPPDTPVVGTVANFRTIKGHRYLVRAASTVLESVPDARFVLVGSGPLEEAVKAQAAAAGLGDRMVFAGFRADAPRLMSMFDVFVLPSTHEGLPISLVEAMALGVAPIVTKVGGNVEVIEHGRQGLLVPPMAPEALARAIVSVLRDAPLRRRLGFGARERARRFDVRHSVWRTEQIYRKLAS